MNFNLLIPSLLIAFQTFSIPSDSLRTTELTNVEVKVFEKSRQKLTSPDAISILTDKIISPTNGTSFLSGLNTQAGVRMEERSPGSYRIAIRGSSLRAPFGVRNIKVYWNQIPFTDAGNNTYLALLEPDLFRQIIITKGPGGGLYGAGTGGAILFNSGFDLKNKVKFQTMYPSLGGLKSSIDINLGNAFKNHRVYASHWQQEGFRVQSAIKKQWISYEFNQSFGTSGTISLTTYYGDLAYQTPGGLTLKQYQDNPRNARPAAGAFKSAVDQQATFKLKSFGVGAQISNQFNSKWGWNLINAFQYNQVENPTIRNYEKRDEPNFSSRGVIHRKGIINIDAGYEWQSGQFNSQTFGNKKGIQDTLQVTQNTHSEQLTTFIQADYEINRQWTLTLSGSLNAYWTQYINQETIFSPRAAIVRKLGSYQSITAKIAQGYSPPSIAEMRPSAGIINTNLQAEKGWNKEIAWRGASHNNLFNWDLTAYLFNLNETIVVRRAADGSDYFANVGETTQKGLELTTSWKAHKYLFINNSTTWQDFRFTDYTTSGKTYNGNFLTGTSPFQNSFLAILTHPSGFSWNQQYIFSDYLYLNDANTDRLPAYRIWNSKIAYQKVKPKFSWELWFAMENILNETYSLGPDLNAAAGRYYNAAPGRNFTIGLKINTF